MREPPVLEKALKTRRLVLNSNGGLSDLERKTRRNAIYAPLSPRRLSFSAAMAVNGRSARRMDGWADDEDGTRMGMGMATGTGTGTRMAIGTETGTRMGMGMGTGTGTASRNGVR